MVNGSFYDEYVRRTLWKSKQQNEMKIFVHLCRTIKNTISVANPLSVPTYSSISIRTMTKLSLRAEKWRKQRAHTHAVMLLMSSFITQTHIIYAQWQIGFCAVFIIVRLVDVPRLNLFSHTENTRMKYLHATEMNCSEKDHERQPEPAFQKLLKWNSWRKFGDK